ncbi:MAG: hypothetical protein LBP50_00130, partial [Tannerella sp.]|nr:hypothetical protein [Tannerella sp.]
MKLRNITGAIAEIILCTALFASVQNVQAQHKEGYNWYFGAYVGMTWNTTQTVGGLSGLPTPLPPSAMTNQQEGVFGMSDANGNLLFYSDGMTVWNRNHQVMTNGSGLTGHNSSAQSGIVIPYPGQSRKYIAVTTGQNSSNNLSYSVIDMDGSGGLGEVTTSHKNVPLTGASGVLGESVAAVRHANSTDFWIVAVGKGSGAASALNVWKVTVSGVQAACFASYPLPANTTASAGANGYLRFSADGKYFAWPEHSGSSRTFFFGEFNPSTGTFPTMKVMDAGYIGYGIEFSPSSKILYATKSGSTEIHAYKFADLLASADPGNMSHRTEPIGGAHSIYPLQLGPDGRIYGTLQSTTTMLVIDDVNDYDAFTTHVVNGLLPTGTNYEARVGLPNYMAYFFAPVENTCSYFTDDLWYFGTGGGGIAFNDDGSGTKVAAAASGESLVSSGENSLSVSSPGCGSSLIFYSQHNQLYNAKHQPMADGSFSGHASVADGLAACYIGDNKYMLFSVTHAYEENTTMALQYHIIDMNEDNGYGRRISTTTLEASGMSESVELAPIPGTSNEYWLIYNMVSPNEIRVRKITGSAVGGVIKTLSMASQSVSGRSYMLQTNTTYNRLVLTYPDNAKLALFDFDTSDGDITLLRPPVSTPFSSGSTYGAEFSPNGKYVYVTTYNPGCWISQYDIASNTFTTPFSYVSSPNGGGLKMGPDGRLYVKRAGRYMGVIADPNAPLTSAGYTQNGFDLGDGITSGGLVFSTGLTPPAVCPAGLNEAPVTTDDAVTIFLDGPDVCLSVLKNDYDPNPGDSINLTNVFFQDAADASKVEISFQPGDSTVCIHAKAAAQEGDVIRLTYTVRDDANPIRLCADGGITVRIGSYPENVTETDCAVPISSMTWAINTTPTLLGNNNISVYQTAYVGDLDSDGHVEIVAAKSFYAGGGGGNANPWSYYANGIYVFDRRNNTSREITVPIFATCGRGQIALAKPHASSQGYIVLAAMNGYLYAYDKAGNLKWTTPNNRSDVPYTTYNVPDNGTGSGFKAASIMFSDFNGDGYAEIVTGDRIFDLETGKLLLDCGFLNGQNIMNPLVSVTDINGDGKPELLWGGNRYSITITSRTGTSGNSFLLMSPAVTDATALAGLPNTSVALTAPVDIDLDGKVDILAYGGAYFYIYDPQTGAVKVRQAIPAADRGAGAPFVGDIDGDKYPEIMYGETATGLNIIAWDIDGHASATVKWRMSTTDGSQGTGLTLFDFNQDEKFEILYRDQTQLRIFDGSTQATMNAPLASIPCLSGTLGEYPVTADVDNDGEAEIIVTGSPAGGSSERGYVCIFNAGTGTRWAPARKVWNQYAYNIVNINEDLTVPKSQFDVATVMAGKDSIMGTADDIQPYNGFLKQSTMIDRYGNMVMYTPDVQLAGAPAFVYDAVGDSLRITFDVTNAGKSAFQPPLYLTAYRDAVLPANAICTDSIAVMINPDYTDTIRCTFVIRNFSDFLPFDDVKIALNDRGQATGVQTECKYGNNEILTPLSAILMAQNDHASTLATAPVAIAVLANDSIPAGCTPTPELIAPFAKHGTATLMPSGDSILYTPSAGFAGYDTAAYRIVCGTDTSVAHIYIYVAETPDNISDADCYITPSAQAWGITPHWSSSSIVSNHIIPMVGDLDNDTIPEIVCFG